MIANADIPWATRSTGAAAAAAVGAGTWLADRMMNTMVAQPEDDPDEHVWDRVACHGEQDTDKNEKRRSGNREERNLSRAKLSNCRFLDCSEPQRDHDGQRGQTE
jgi:hypothetical protein